MKKYFKTSAILVLACFFSFCSKDEREHKRMNEKLIGVYDIVQYTVDGADSLNSVKNNGEDELEFNYYSKDSPESNHRQFFHITSSSALLGYYYFYDDYNTLSLETHSYTSTKIYPLKASGTTYWDFVKFTDAEVEIKTIYENKQYCLGLKKK